MDRNSAWTRYSVQNNTKLYDGCFWNPEEKDKHQWEYINPVVDEDNIDEGIRIYESHVGMALEDGRVGQYREYVD